MDAARQHMVDTDTRIADTHGEWFMAARAVNEAERCLAWFKKNRRTSAEIERAVDKLTDAESTAATAHAAFVQADRQYKGWSRFYLVKSNNGHIHRDMHCHSCTPSTQYGWLVELAGLTDKDAVKTYGGILCTFCYPEAPVEWTDGENKVEAKQKAEEKWLTKAAGLKPVKKAKDKQENIARFQDAVESAERRIEQYEDWKQRGPGRGSETPAEWSATQDRRISQEEERMTLYRKKLSNAEKTLPKLEAAADAALEEFKIATS